MESDFHVVWNIHEIATTQLLTFCIWLITVHLAVFRNQEYCVFHLIRSLCFEIAVFLLNF